MSQRRQGRREGVEVVVVDEGLVRWQRRRQRRLRRLPPVDLDEEVLGSLPEELVGELPSVCHYLPETLQQQQQLAQIRFTPVIVIAAYHPGRCVMHI
jgi:hypothetical protein